MPIAILGAGAMGSALTIPLADNGAEVRLWGTEFDTKIIELLRKGEPHPSLGISLPDSVKTFTSEELGKALEGCELAVLATSSEGAINIGKKAMEQGRELKALLIATKGLLEVEGKITTIPEALGESLPKMKLATEKFSNQQIFENNIYEKVSKVAIAGPSIAKEVAQRKPTKVVFASEDKENLLCAKKLFETKNYKVELSQDIKGVELCAALKNVYAIGLGIAGCFGNNIKSYLFWRAVEEMGSIAEACGGKHETAYGLAGIGDLQVTMISGRNTMFGELVGKNGLDSALREIREKNITVEGLAAAKMAKKLIEEKNIKGAEFLEAVYSVLYENKEINILQYL